MSWGGREYLYVCVKPPVRSKLTTSWDILAQFQKQLLLP